MSDEMSLQTQLAEKEELVAALTERLELAAEQLDRLQRTGANRGAPGGGGLPAALIERQETLADELQQAVRQWQEMQAGLTLNNLEAQVAELRDLVSSGLAAGVRPLAGREAVESSEEPPDRAGDDDPEDEGEDRWAALKSYLLEEDSAQDETSAPAVPPAAASDCENSDASSGEAESKTAPAAPLESVAPPPAAPDANTTDPAALWAAIESRDEYIAFLIRRMRHTGSHSALPADWAEREAMPAELCREVEALQERLTEQLRLSELELSLERARLGREQSRIREMEESTRRNMRRLGLDPDLDGCDEFESESDASTGNRWLKMLGIGRDEDEDEDDEDYDED